MLAVRPRAGATGAFPLRVHEILGWLTLGAALLHAGVSLSVDSRVLEHLKLTAPHYEMAGIVALLALVFLTAPAGAALRSRLWSSHRNFQAMHVGAACVLVVTLALHVVATDRYVHGRAHRVGYILLSSVVLLALLRARSQRQPAKQPSSFVSALAFGRHSRLLLVITVGSLVALTAVMRPGSTLALREPFFSRSERLLLDFPHDKHRAVNCVLCHHNFADQSGSESCVSCHRSRRAEIRVGVEARFHDFCLGCHRDPPAYLTGHGPVTGCKGCHAPPQGG
jgi:predicted CXXCH cytochrome family protein